jgi:hypothetical protein
VKSQGKGEKRGEKRVKAIKKQKKTADMLCRPPKDFYFTSKE